MRSTAVMLALVALAGCATRPVDPAAALAIDAPAQWQAPLPHNGQLSDLGTLSGGNSRENRSMRQLVQPKKAD